MAKDGSDVFCTKVSPQCPVENTVYGYFPNLGANIFFLIFFAVFLLIQVGQGFRYKTAVFTTFMTIGCAGELVGYVGRCLMHYNPYDNNAFEIQISTLIFSPAFFAAALYLTIKHVVINICPQKSRIPPAAYTWIFITCDLISLVLQAAGGGIAAGGDTDDITSMGGNIMLAGIVFQVFTLTCLLGLAVDYIVRVSRDRQVVSPEAMDLMRSRSFRLFMACLVFAFLGIYIRCLYRIAELAHGWANTVMRSEVDFIVLDGVMCCIAALGLTVGHPGFLFKPMLVTGFGRDYVKGAAKGEKYGHASDSEPIGQGRSDSETV